MNWREWIHLPWHCLYCWLTGFGIGWLMLLLLLAFGAYLHKTGVMR